MIIEIDFKSGKQSFLKVNYVEKFKEEITLILTDNDNKAQSLKLEDIKNAHLFFNGTVRVLHQEKCDD